MKNLVNEYLENEYDFDNSYNYMKREKPIHKVRRMRNN